MKDGGATENTLDKMPTISVIILTHNRARLVEQAAKSVLAQTYSDWELLVVDDGSTDETPRVGKALKKLDGRIKYLPHANVGECENRNIGLRNATGRYIAFLDDDDEWLPEKLAVQVGYMESHPEAGITCTYAVGGRTSDGRPNMAALYGRPMTDPLEDLLNWPSFISTSSLMFRRRCMESVGEFSTRYKVCGDQEFLLRFTQRWPMACIEQVLTVHGAKDGRPQLTDDLIGNQLWAIRMFGELRFLPELQRYEGRRRRHIARIHYSVARDLIDARRYWEAARHFAAAVATDPFVGTMVRRPGENGGASLGRLLKPYLAAPWCMMRGVRASILRLRSGSARTAEAR